MQGLIDKDAELARLNRELEKIGKDHKKIKDKLDNPSYVQKAPPEVVEKDKALLIDLQSAQQKILSSIDRIAALQ